jgi:hypothetical protein
VAAKKPKDSIFSPFFFFLLPCGTGVWTKGLILARQANRLYHLSHGPKVFFIFCGLFFGFCTGALNAGPVLARQALYHLSHPSSPLRILDTVFVVCFFFFGRG